MKSEDLMIRDSSGRKSLTATAFIIGFIVVNLKLLLSSMTFLHYTSSTFTGIEYAAAIGGLSALYIGRRNFGTPNSEGENEDK